MLAVADQLFPLDQQFDKVGFLECLLQAVAETLPVVAVISAQALGVKLGEIPVSNVGG